MVVVDPKSWNSGDRSYFFLFHFERLQFLPTLLRPTIFIYMPNKLETKVQVIKIIVSVLELAKNIFSTAFVAQAFFCQISNTDGI